MRLVTVLLVLALGACAGRPLAPPEKAFLATLHGEGLDTGAIRIHGGFRPGTRISPTPPRVTCQSRLFPPIETPTYRGSTPAMTVFNDIFVRDDWNLPDLTGGYPEVLDLAAAMLLAHETLHAWQWQHRHETGYHPLKAVFEHVGSADPYLFDPDTRADFASFGYEQQGSILEEYLCCRILAPDAERTRRLHEMLGQALPLTPLSRPIAREVLLPWKGVELEGICG
jgi:hypothetical protein